MELDYDRINMKNDPGERIDYIKDQLRQMDIKDPVYISDFLARQQREGGDILIALSELVEDMIQGQEPLPMWRIKVLRDEWGNAPVPGDIVTWTAAVNRVNRHGNALSSNEQNMALVDGSFKKKYERDRKYTVDEKGCILCQREDAVNFLNTYGIHGKTGFALPHGKLEHSTDPCKAPNGQTLHVWYWRYAEQSKEMYEKLPVLEKQGDLLSGDKSKKRGRD